MFKMLLGQEPWQEMEAGILVVVSPCQAHGSHTRVGYRQCARCERVKQLGPESLCHRCGGENEAPSDTRR